MADNLTLPLSGTGTATPVVATDDVSSVHYQKVKLDGGGDGVSLAIIAGQQTMANSLPVALASNQSALPVTDNSSSLTVDAPVGTPVFARLSDGSAALVGQKTAANSLPVTVASDQSNLPVAGNVASDIPVTANPLLDGGRASATAPSAVSTDGDAVAMWCDRRGAVVSVVANPAGKLIGREAIYNYNIVSQVHVAAANTIHWDFFNADAALIVRVLSIRQIPNITTAVTGIVFDWKLARTTAVGTGGSAQTAWLVDSTQAALDADITCRSKPTGGATEGTILFNYSLSSEETNAATIQIASQGGLELVPNALLPQNGGQGIVLRQNEGLRCVQITSSAAGNTAWFISFSVE